MTVLFWNINGNDVSEYLKDLTSNQDIDILVLIESELKPNDILDILNEQITLYFYCPNIANTDIQIFTKFPDDLIQPINESPRHTARQLIIPSKQEEFLFIVVHYQSKLRWSDSSQAAHSPALSKFIEKSENLAGHQKTIVLGDFNMNPFEYGMIQTTGLHATMDKQTALEASRTIDGNNYKYFYNPMWSFFGEQGKGEVNGTYYHRKKGHICYYWNILDQVIFRPEVIEYFDEDSLQIITNTPNYNLLKSNGRVNENISDHLPVMFKLNF